MGVILLIAATLMTPLFEAGSIRYLALLVLVLIGVVSYFGAGHVFGAFKLSEFRRNLRR